MNRPVEPLVRFLEPAAGELDPELALDRYRGALLGLAVGNALGGPVEGRTADEIRRLRPEGIREIDPGVADGAWDDDVAQAIELAGCVLKGPLDLDAFLRCLLRWGEENGRGMGSQTRRVLRLARAGHTSGTEAARRVWEESGRRAAGNGAVMRCAPVALRWRRDPRRLVLEAAHSARVTHYDPRCVWTTVAVCTVLAHALSGTDPAFEDLAGGLARAGAPDEVADAVRFAAESGLNELDLDERSSMGYTVRTMTVGIWAFVNAGGFESTVIDVIQAGGDTDTNGAVAGAVLGARLGASAIPARWLERLPDGGGLRCMAERLWERQVRSPKSEVRSQRWF